jgi:NADH dehydrogenase
MNAQTTIGGFLMKKKCLIIGGGYAGLNMAAAISKELKDEYDIYLMDKNAYHFRKVLLFKEAGNGKELTIPFKKLLPKNVQFIKGELLSIQKNFHEVNYYNHQGQEETIKYDKLVLAFGSISKPVPSEYGGIALKDIQSAKEIQKTWKSNFRKSKKTSDISKRNTLLSIAIVGAGITGIETAAELAYSMKQYAEKIAIDPRLVSIYLVNSRKDIFEQAAPYIRKKIRKEIEKCGITILDDKKGDCFENNILLLNNRKEKLAVGIVIWTLGLIVNPIVYTLDLPLTPKGKIIVNQNYQVESDIYSIGDCAHIVDQKTGKVDNMTCKEAVPQANRLVKIFKAELNHKPLPKHQSYTSLFCVSMGPNSGIFWMKIGKQNLFLKSKLGWWMRAYTWNSVSLQKGLHI